MVAGWSKPDPHRGDRARGEAHEPGVAVVVGGARLAGHRERDAEGARAAAGAAVDDVAQHAERLERHRLGQDPPARDGLVPGRCRRRRRRRAVMPRGRTARPPLAKGA